ncbi:hypothetical protein J4418_01325 [Candidatus Woesearchaeota archaeon]|nr:hypothetical protein [Candidatus Woesearchaeota archaeon]
MHRRKFSMFKFVGVLAATTLIFMIGIQLGNYLSSIKITRIEDLQNNIKVDTLGLETQLLIVSKNPCEILKLGIMDEELYEIGSKLAYIESQYGHGDESVQRLKNYYSILELRHWILLNNVKEKCNIDYDLILYFYSNELDCNDCEKQGFVLDYIRRTNSNVKIYSLEYSLDNPAINTIKALYKIKAEELPVIIINGEAYTGFKDKAEFESLQ